MCTESRRRISIASGLALTIVLYGCASEPKPFETPAGASEGQQFGDMEIIGIANHATTSLNRPNFFNPPFDEDVTIDVPVGTEFIIPSIRGWRLVYGELTPNSVDAHLDKPGATALWKSADHHFGQGAVNVFVEDVNAPDLSVTPPKQTARLKVSMGLSDFNGDDRWFGLVNYSLIFLKRRTPPLAGISAKPSQVRRR